MKNANTITSGCQCGAVRYSIASLGRSSVCHCRMCQRAFGAFYTPLATVNGLKWTSGTRGLFASSNVSQRGFCGDCGTPLSLENFGDDEVEIATGSLDEPELAAPSRQVNHRDACSFTDGIGKLPEPSDEKVADNDAWNAKITSRVGSSLKQDLCASAVPLMLTTHPKNQGTLPLGHKAIYRADNRALLLERTLPMDRRGGS